MRTFFPASVVGIFTLDAYDGGPYYLSGTPVNVRSIWVSRTVSEFSTVEPLIEFALTATTLELGPLA